VAAGVLALATVVVIGVLRPVDDGVAVRLEPVESTTELAFTDSVATVGPATVTGFSSRPEAAGSAAAGGSLAEVTGTAPRLYGSGAAPVCDTAALSAALGADPALAAAWADAAGVDVAAIGDVLAGLSPVVLGADTAVTNHEYRRGAARAFQAVLQAGTPVLVDAFGAPRVKCSCGNPLRPPTVSSLEGARLDGRRWGGFDAAAVVRVAPADAAVGQLTTVDLASRQDATTPVGTTTTTSTTTTTTTTTLAPQPVLDDGGVGALRLGMTEDAARAAGLVGESRPGCDLGGPGQTVARLQPPLAGWATFWQGQLESVEVESGAATVDGVSVGMGVDEARRRIEERGRPTFVTDLTDPFGFFLVSVGEQVSAYEMEVDPVRRTVDSITVPSIRTCE
jgi:hypothetical protein